MPYYFDFVFFFRELVCHLRLEAAFLVVGYLYLVDVTRSSTTLSEVVENHFQRCLVDRVLLDVGKVLALDESENEADGLVELGDANFDVLGAVAFQDLNSAEMLE